MYFCSGLWDVFLRGKGLGWGYICSGRRGTFLFEGKGVGVFLMSGTTANTLILIFWSGFFPVFA